jgi:hypothetical protein
MQKKKTRFEQVPIKVAEQALRLRTGGPQTVAHGNLTLRNRPPTRVARRRFQRRYLWELGHRRIN